LLNTGGPKRAREERKEERVFEKRVLGKQQVGLFFREKRGVKKKGKKKKTAYQI